MTGIDHAFTHWGAGATLDYSSTSATIQPHAGHFHIHQLVGSGYATWVPPSLQDLAVNAIVGYGYDGYQIQRKAGSKLISRKAQGDTHGQTADALLGAEYIFSQEQFQNIPRDLLLTPFLNFQFIWANIDGYHEQDAGIFALKIQKQQARSLRSCLGVRFDYLVVGKNVTFQPELDLAWQLEYLDPSRKLLFTTIDAPNAQSIDTGILGAGRNTLLLGIDFLLTVYKVFEVEISYDFQGNSFFKNHAFYLGIGGNF